MPGLVGDAEDRAGRRDVLLAEAGPGDDAAGLAGLRAERGRLEAAADQLALRHQDVEAGEDGELHALVDGGVGLDLRGDQLDQMHRALAVADQDEGAALVAGGEKVAPGGEHVAIGLDGGLRDVLAGGKSDDRADRHLAVYRRIDLAHRREARGLGGGGADFLRHVEVAVEAWSRETVG